MKNKNIIFFVVAIVCLIIAIFSLSARVTSTYIPYDELVSSAGTHVQIIGKIDKGKKLIFEEDRFHFILIGKNDHKLNISYRGVLPQNFDHADQVVALGTYDAKKNLFLADRIITKCPSKYEKKVK